MIMEKIEATMKSKFIRISGRFVFTSVVVIAFMTSITYAQEFKWMSAGSIHNWFSNMGSEEEEGFVKEQQYGLQWPAIYTSQGKLDMQAAKGLWIGYKDYAFAGGVVAPLVVHIGPRVHGFGEMFPVKFAMYSKYDIPQVVVDGNVSEGKSIGDVTVDATIPSDRMIVNVVNTYGGITMTRKIMQFSQSYHDNYMVYDYQFKNTGNTSSTDTTVVASAKTLTGVYFYFQYRYAVCADTRYVIGQNPTGWGINEMNDFRGDGLTPSSPFFSDPTTNGINYNIRAGYSWHGKYPPFTLYDNIGGPIWTPYYDKTDTVGRLGAAQFIGVATLYADKSATDKTDDVNQPSTTSYEGSDEPNNSNNDRLNTVKNSAEYAWMTKGHVSPRHADKVGSSGDPAIGTSGGYSMAIGYGPYTLAPGQSIHFVQAEAAAGLDRQAAAEIGKQFKANAGNVSTLINYKGVSKTKNDWVYTGRDSLFLTFNRAIANFQSGYAIPQPPLPPKSFTVTSGGDKITLSWEVFNAGDPNLKGFDVYRALGRYDSTYALIYSAGSTERSYKDTSVIRGLSYYYYLVSKGDPALNNGSGKTPAGALTSNRYLTQTYDPAFLRRAAGNSLADIRVVPNPYNISGNSSVLFDNNRIGFLNIPGECSIKIYTELGELIYKTDHNDGSGDAYWNSLTSSNQVVVSGIYIVVIETPKGERAFRKFVVIR
jgi:hypothetical protein